MCVRIFQSFQFQVAYRMKNGMCVYDCVRACVCVCAWQMVAPYNIYLIALAAKGLSYCKSISVQCCVWNDPSITVVKERT